MMNINQLRLFTDLFTILKRNESVSNRRSSGIYRITANKLTRILDC
jgi:hypothetical protein